MLIPTAEEAAQRIAAEGKPKVAGPGTCKKIGCPGWGVSLTSTDHPDDTHGAAPWEQRPKIGAPDTFAPYAEGMVSPRGGVQYGGGEVPPWVTIYPAMAARIEAFLRVCATTRDLERVDVEEASILATHLAERRALVES